KNTLKNVAAVQAYAVRENQRKPRQLYIRFLVSPTELIGEAGQVHAVKINKNELYTDDQGALKARATTAEEIIPAGLVFRSVGYRGKPLPDVPFNESWGTIANHLGAITNNDGSTVPGMYTAGWIKRGPSGVIGTNKTCAQETVGLMVADLAMNKHFQPTDTDPAAIEALVRSRQPDLVSYADWKKVDLAELAAGDASNRPRVKISNVNEMLELIRS
ncbi:MAG: hypothetical protein OSB45_12745, partial [Pseudomonadales bacterium]|nr:hypothetical protein [Pseudomonadales bacterium]